MDLYRALTCNTSLIRYRFPYFGADLRKLVFQSGTSEHTIVHDVFRTRVLNFGGDNFRGLQMRDETSVSKTIRKPLLVKAQTALKTKKIKYGKKRLSIWQIEFLYLATWHDHDIDFAR